MSAKEIQITCPCCESTLVVDVLTGTVLKHAPKPKFDSAGREILDESRWDQAHDKVVGKKGRGADAFDQALDREQTRDRDLEDLFQKAKTRAQRRGTGELPDA